MIIKILNTKGIHAELATDGQEAVDLFHSHGPYHYQAILMDLMMPVKDGFETSMIIRSMNTPDAQSIPIIALTADITEDVEDRCREAGMFYCVSKPIDPGKLFAYLGEGFQKQIHWHQTDENSLTPETFESSPNPENETGGDDSF